MNHDTTSTNSRKPGVRDFLVKTTSKVVLLPQLLCFRMHLMKHSICHGTPHLHTPDHLQSSPTLSAYTPVSLRCTLHKLAQPHHSCHRTKLGSMSNFPGLSPYVSGRCLFVFFSICRICLMHFH